MTSMSLLAGTTVQVKSIKKKKQLLLCIGEQRMLWGACTIARTRQSLRRWHTQRMDEDEGSDQNFKPLASIGVPRRFLSIWDKNQESKTSCTCSLL